MMTLIAAALAVAQPAPAPAPAPAPMPQAHAMPMNHQEHDAIKAQCCCEHMGDMHNMQAPDGQPREQHGQ